MRIRMIDDDVIHGNPRDCYNCPVARAIAREMDMCDGDGTPDFVYVTDRFVEVGCDPKERFYFPAEVTAFIHSYDKGKELDPIEFDIPDVGGIVSS